MGIGWRVECILNKEVRGDFSAKGSFEQNLNEMRGEAILIGKEYSSNHAKALGFV